MISKIIGALLVITACAGIGCAVAGMQKREIRYLVSVIRSLELIRCELEYRMTPLPQLCKMAGEHSTDLIGRWFDSLSELLSQREAPNIDRCTQEVMTIVPGYYSHITDVLGQLCQSMGRFDLTGQLNGIDGVLQRCRVELDHLTKGVEQRTRSIRTLGFCAGTALAILLM